MTIEDLKKLDIKILENEPLANHTTFQIGGPARYFIEVKETEDLIKILQFAKEKSLPYMFIGGGSNLLISDQGFSGVIIKIIPHELKIEGELVTVDAGYSLAGLIMATLEAGLTGLEFEAGVPGSVGGAIKGNAGTYGEAMDKVVDRVNYIDENLEIKSIAKTDCNFSYRQSIFKEQESWMIISAVLKFNKGDVEASRKLIDERISYRQDTQPYGYPSAGCSFKNIVYTEAIAKKIKLLGWDMPERFKEYKKIPVAWVIEHLDLKGKTIGKAQISEKHGNYIVNLGGAKADEVMQLISYIKQQVRDQVGIQLHEEVRYLGF